MKYEQLLFKYLENVKRQILLRPLGLGGTFKGSGGPPGGFIGFLPQTKVSYDITEAEIAGFPSGYVTESGVLISGSLVDNLNHIRYRIAVLEDEPGSFDIYDDGELVASGITILDFTTGLNVTVSGTHASVATESGLGNEIVWFFDGELAVLSGVGYTYVAPRDFVIDSVILHGKTLGTSGISQFDVNKNGTSIFGGTKPQLSYSGTDYSVTIPSTITVAKFDKLTVDIDTIATDASSFTLIVTQSGTLLGGTGGTVSGGSNIASDIITDTSNFNGNLSASDTTVQKALDTLDNMTFSGSVPTLSAYAIAHADSGGNLTSDSMFTYKKTAKSLVIGRDRIDDDDYSTVTIVADESLDPDLHSYGLKLENYGWGEISTYFANGTAASPTIVTSGDYLYYMGVYGRLYDGSAGFHYNGVVADMYVEALTDFTSALGAVKEARLVFSVANPGPDAGLTEILALYGDRIEVPGEIVADSATITDINIDTSAFNGVLSAADDTVQKALNTLDSISVSSGNFDLGGVFTTDDQLIVSSGVGGYTILDPPITSSLLSWTSIAGVAWGELYANGVPTNTINFNGNLSSSDDTVQKALDTLDNLTISGGGTTVAVSENDTTPDYLENKLVAGSGITLATQNEGGNETILINCACSGTSSITISGVSDLTGERIQVAFITFEGTLTTGENKIRLLNKSGKTRTIESIYLIVETAPTGQSLIVDVHRNGTTIFTDQDNRPTITAGNTTGNTATIDVPSWDDNDYITAYVDQVGSIVAGSYLTVHIVYSTVEPILALSGSVGHDIMFSGISVSPQRYYLNFTGNVTVSDDSVNNRTVVNIPTQSGTSSTGGGAYLPIDIAPTSAHAKDDEFSGTTLDVKWTNPLTSAAGQTISYTQTGGWLYFEPATTGTGNTGKRVFGISQAAPAGSFTVYGKVVDALIGADVRCGIFVARYASTAWGYILGIDQSGGKQSCVIGVTTPSASADWSSYNGTYTTLTPAWNGNPMWVRMIYNASASTLDFDISWNGVFWRAAAFTQKTSVTQPDTIGVCMYSNSSTVSAHNTMGIDWFRVTEP